LNLQYLKFQNKSLIRLRSFFFSLALLFLPTQLGKHFWPSFSIISGIRVDYLSPTLYLTDIFIFLLFVSWLLSISNKSWRKVFSIKYYVSSTFTYWQISLFVFWLILGVAFSSHPLAGMYGVVKLSEFGFFGWYVSQEKQVFSKIVSCFSVGLVIESVIAFLQFYFKRSIGGVFYFLGERFFTSDTPGIANASINGELILRPYATFPHPNVLAGFLLLSITLILFSMHSGKKWLLVLCGTVALFLTLSRLPIVLWIGIVCFYLSRFFATGFKKIVSVVVVLVTVLFLFPTPLFHRFSELSLSDQTISDRLTLISFSLSVITKQPLLGVGFYNFLYNLASTQLHKQFFFVQPVHNIYLLIAAETGIVGLLFFLWFLYKTFSQVMNKKKFYDFRFVLLASILIIGFFDHYFVTLQQGQLLFAAVLGLCWNKKKV
jgi:O-antigen ligase